MSTNNNKNVYIKQRVLLAFITLLFVAFYSFLGIAGYEVFSEKERLSQAADVDVLGERLVPIFYQINAFSKRAAQEVLFLSKLSSLKNVLSRPSPATYEELLKTWPELLLHRL